MGNHRRHERRAGLLLTTSLSIAGIVGILGAIAGVIIVVAPFGIGAERPAKRTPTTTADTRGIIQPMAPSSPLAGATFAGTAPVGALFDLSGGSLGGHYCSASVVDSSAGDVLITAAHCAAGGTLAFVPDYHSGEMPYGVWPIAQVVTDAQWRSAHDPDDDIAFLIVHRHGSSTPIEKVTGAERLGIGQPTGQVARVIGYPSHADSPVICQNRVSAESSTQMRFDCANYPAGTSGGPFLVDVDPLTGKGMVIGVIGGYEQGGYTPSVSYSPAFGQRVEALFQTAVSEG